MSKIRIEPLDKLFSEFIRRRAGHGCERCGHWKASYLELECSHFIGRAKKSVRWDEGNAAGLCFGCHQYLGSHPLEHVEWFKQRLGDKFDLLLARSRTPAKYLDKKAIEIYLKEKISELT